MTYSEPFASKTLIIHGVLPAPESIDADGTIVYFASDQDSETTFYRQETRNTQTTTKYQVPSSSSTDEVPQIYVDNDSVYFYQNDPASSSSLLGYSKDLTESKSKISFESKYEMKSLIIVDSSHQYTLGILERPTEGVESQKSVAIVEIRNRRSEGGSVPSSDYHTIFH